MKTLPIKICGHWSSDWTQLKREGDIAIYRQDIGTSIRYNVVHIRKRKENIAFKTAAHEALPSASEWGIYGMTFFKKESAEKLFDEWVRDRGVDKVK